MYAGLCTQDSVLYVYYRYIPSNITGNTTEYGVLRGNRANPVYRPGAGKIRYGMIRYGTADPLSSPHSCSVLRNLLLVLVILALPYVISRSYRPPQFGPSLTFFASSSFSILLQQPFYPVSNC